MVNSKDGDEFDFYMYVIGIEDSIEVIKTAILGSNVSQTKIRRLFIERMYEIWMHETRYNVYMYSILYPTHHDQI